MADILNNFFSSAFTKENKDMTEVTMRFNVGDERSLRDIIITPDMVKLKISKLKEDKAPGDDGITPKFLKEVVDEIAEPLTKIFNESISEGVVPQDWKIANVTPMFKKGTKLDSGNYRPVSLTSHIGKLLESLIRDAMINHLSHNRLINKSQHGLRHKKSCLTNLLEYLEYVVNQTDAGDPVDVIYLLSKSFRQGTPPQVIAKVKGAWINGFNNKSKIGWLTENREL